MAAGYKITDQYGIHFVTFTVLYWIDAFTRLSYREILIEALEYSQRERGLQVHAFVIMSNHVHLVISSKGKPLSAIIRDYKKWTATNILEAIQKEGESRRKWMMRLFEWAGRRNPRNQILQFWVQDNHPIYLDTGKLIEQKINYIHQNPVKAGIVYEAEDYRYSSASNYAGLDGVLQVDLLVDE